MFLFLDNRPGGPSEDVGDPVWTFAVDPVFPLDGDNLVVTCADGTSAKVPTCVAMSSPRNMPRCPPASRPWAITASTPRASSQSASSTVVAEARTFAPHARTSCSSSGAGRPK